jgi:hypothetical protein
MTVAILPWIVLLQQLSYVAPAGFLSVGDWGSAALGGYHQRNAMDTAAAMKTARIDQDQAPLFVINTGDNFYYCGIQNTSDPQINEDYTALFGGMGIPWYHSLGNHDYGFSPEAQTALNDTISGWIMDGRYYHRRIIIPSDHDDDDNASLIINIIVLDTNPCIRDYRGEDRQKWDPCGTEYPDCSPVTDVCRFHENILSQDCEQQLSWAKGVLASIPDNHKEWVFVVGHHKADEINVADFQTTILDDTRVHLYLNGHAHNFEHYEINGHAKYMTTGAGGMVMFGAVGAAADADAAADAAAATSRAKSIWMKAVTGFTSHTFINDGKTVRTDFWDVKKNESIYSFEVDV